MSAALVFVAPPPTVASIADLAEMAVLSLPSPASRRNYSRELRCFIASGQPLTREGVQRHIASIRDRNVGPVGQNVALAAIKLLTREAEARGLVDWQQVAAIDRIKSSPIRGSRTGNWMTLGEARAFLDAVAAISSRNAALVAVLIGCGLRRGEVAALDWEQWQQRDGRWCWLDIVGKGGRVRTVPCPDWASEYVRKWKGEQENDNGN